jgi:WhiB family redox-sensing transcriptional regulator
VRTLSLLEAPEWFARAACRGSTPTLFYPEQHTGPYFDVREAKAICAGCLARQDCLDFALDRFETIGIWGGLTPKERREVKRERAS